MRRQRWILLVLLGGAAPAAVLGSFLYVQLDRIRVMDEQIGFLRRQYLKLLADAPAQQDGLEQRIEGLKHTEADELGRYYASAEMDPYRFGGMVTALLARRGISVDQLRTLSGSSAPVLELRARGTSVAFMAFLFDVSTRPKYWSVPYLHIQSPSGDGKATCELQIGYLVHEAAR